MFDQALRILRTEMSLAGNRSARDGRDELVELPERPFAKRAEANRCTSLKETPSSCEAPRSKVSNAAGLFRAAQALGREPGANVDY